MPFHKTEGVQFKPLAISNPQAHSRSRSAIHFSTIRQTAPGVNWLVCSAFIVHTPAVATAFFISSLRSIVSRSSAGTVGSAWARRKIW